MNWMQRAAYRRTVFEQVQAGDRVKVNLSDPDLKSRGVTAPEYLKVVRKIAKNPAGVKVLAVHGNDADIAEDNPMGVVMGTASVPLSALKHEQFGFMTAVGSAPGTGWEVIPDALDPGAWNIFFGGDLEYIGSADEALVFLKGHADSGDAVNVRNREGASSGVMTVGEVRLTDFVEGLKHEQQRITDLGTAKAKFGARLLATAWDAFKEDEFTMEEAAEILDAGGLHPQEVEDILKMFETVEQEGPAQASTTMRALGLESMKHEQIDPDIERVLRAHGFEPVGIVQSPERGEQWVKRKTVGLVAGVFVKNNGGWDIFDYPVDRKDAPEKVASGRGARELEKDLRQFMGEGVKHEQESKFVRFGFSPNDLGEALEALSQLGIENSIDRDRSSREFKLVLVKREDIPKASAALTRRGLTGRFNIQGPQGLEPVPMG